MYGILRQWENCNDVCLENMNHEFICNIKGLAYLVYKTMADDMM